MNDIVKLKNRVEALYETVEDLFVEDAKKTIKNYLKHYEYEMAFEAIFIELISIDQAPNEFNSKNALNLGKDLNLDNQNNVVLDSDFWDKFTKYLTKF